MALNRIIADSIADGTVVASDIADGTITLAKLQSGLLPPATANSAAAYANAAFATANTGTASGSYANSAFATANTGSASGSYANSAFATANTGSASGSYANSAFTVANNSLGVNTTQNTNITSAASYANGAFAKANTAGVGTVTSVGTGNGLQGGTITTSGTLSLAAPSYDSVGSYASGKIPSNVGALSGGSTFAGSAFKIYTAIYNDCFASMTQNTIGQGSGTWRYMGIAVGGNQQVLAVRVS